MIGAKLRRPRETVSKQATLLSEKAHQKPQIRPNANNSIKFETQDPPAKISKLVTFDADFECANCDQVRYMSDREFHVWMRNDTNGSGVLQWFGFRMSNSKNFTGKIRIVIVNFSKPRSLFQNVSKIGSIKSFF
jgi:hypothetical protein